MDDTIDLVGLMDRCKCEIMIIINPHKSYYESVERYFDGREEDCDVEEIPEHIMETMVRLDTIKWVMAHPNTPVGSFSCYHYSLGCAIRNVIESIDEYNAPKEGK